MVVSVCVCRRLSISLAAMKSIAQLLPCFISGLSRNERLSFSLPFFLRRARQSDAQIHSAQLRALSRTIPSPAHVIDSEVRGVMEALCARVEADAEAREVSGLRRQVTALVQLRETYELCVALKR